MISVWRALLSSTMLIEDWRKAGADIRDEDRVHLDRNLVRELIQSIPESFTYHARNPANNLPFGKDHSMFIPMTGAPYLRDLEDKRRGPTRPSWDHR